MGTVIAVGGPPHSGKSVLLRELYSRLLARSPHGVFLQAACPDGEGMWSCEASSDVAARLRRKGAFTEEWMDFALRSIRAEARSKRLVLVDLGGKLADDNREILKLCQFIIVLSAVEDQMRAWSDFANESGCPALALLRSALVRAAGGALDMTARSEVRLKAEPIAGSLFNLDREAPSDCYRDAVDSLAGWMTDRFLP